MDYKGHEQGKDFPDNRKNLLEDSGLAKSAKEKKSVYGSQKTINHRRSSSGK